MHHPLVAIILSLAIRDANAGAIALGWTELRRYEGAQDACQKRTVVVVEEVVIPGVFRVHAIQLQHTTS